MSHGPNLTANLRRDPCAAVEVIGLFLLTSVASKGLSGSAKALSLAPWLELEFSDPTGEKHTGGSAATHVLVCPPLSGHPGHVGSCNKGIVHFPWMQTDVSLLGQQVSTAESVCCFQSL